MEKTYQEKIVPRLYQFEDCLFIRDYKRYDYSRVWVASLRKLKSAHFITYSVCVGPVPFDLFVLHRCNHKGCVNPAHLYLGTNQINQIDASRDNLHRLGPTGVRGVSSTWRNNKMKYRAVSTGRPRECLYYGNSLEEAIEARRRWEALTNFR